MSHHLLSRWVLFAKLALFPDMYKFWSGKEPCMEGWRGCRRHFIQQNSGFIQYGENNLEREKRHDIFASSNKDKRILFS